MTPMPSRISDTNQASEQVQIALLRQAGMARRVDLAAELTSFAIEAAYTALRRRYPGQARWRSTCYSSSSSMAWSLPPACALRSCHRQASKTNETPLYLQPESPPE